MNIFYNSQTIRVWITHKSMSPEFWFSHRKWYIKEMFWRYKTFKFMKNGDYLLYGILDNEVPYEVLWVKFDNVKKVGTWKNKDNPDQEDLRAKIDMSKSIPIFTDRKKLKIKTLKEIL